MEPCIAVSSYSYTFNYFFQALNKGLWPWKGISSFSYNIDGLNNQLQSPLLNNVYIYLPTKVSWMLNLYR